MRDVLSTIGLLVVLGGVVTAALFGGYWATAYFSPRYEAVRRDTFEQSRAFLEGTARHLESLCLELKQTEDPANRAMLRATFSHEMAAFPADRLGPCARTLIQGQ